MVYWVIIPLGNTHFGLYTFGKISVYPSALISILGVGVDWYVDIMTYVNVFHHKRWGKLSESSNKLNPVIAILKNIENVEKKKKIEFLKH